jgi:hypothetical protein
LKISELKTISSMNKAEAKRIASLSRPGYYWSIVRDCDLSAVVGHQDAQSALIDIDI